VVEGLKYGMQSSGYDKSRNRMLKVSGWSYARRPLLIACKAFRKATTGGRGGPPVQGRT